MVVRDPAGSAGSIAARCACCNPALQLLTLRMNADLSRRGFLWGATAGLMATAVSGGPAGAQQR